MSSAPLSTSTSLSQQPASSLVATASISSVASAGTIARQSKTSLAASAFKTGFVYGGTALLSAVNGLTPHLAGAVDIMVVEQPDGSLKSSPFYVRFGKYTPLRNRDRIVKLFVNGEVAEFCMHLGSYGHAYFAAETTEITEEEDEAAILAGIISPPSEYSSGDEAAPYANAEVLSEVQREVQRLKNEHAVAGCTIQSWSGEDDSGAGGSSGALGEVGGSSSGADTLTGLGGSSNGALAGRPSPLLMAQSRRSMDRPSFRSSSSLMHLDDGRGYSMTGAASYDAGDFLSPLENGEMQRWESALPVASSAAAAMAEEMEVVKGGVAAGGGEEEVVEEAARAAAEGVVAAAAAQEVAAARGGKSGRPDALSTEGSGGAATPSSGRRSTKSDNRSDISSLPSTASGRVLTPHGPPPGPTVAVAPSPLLAPEIAAAVAAHAQAEVGAPSAALTAQPAGPKLKINLLGEPIGGSTPSQAASDDTPHASSLAAASSSSQTVTDQTETDRFTPGTAVSHTASTDESLLDKPSNDECSKPSAGEPLSNKPSDDERSEQQPRGRPSSLAHVAIFGFPDNASDNAEPVTGTSQVSSFAAFAGSATGSDTGGSLRGSSPKVESADAAAGPHSDRRGTGAEWKPSEPLALSNLARPPPPSSSGEGRQSVSLGVVSDGAAAAPLPPPQHKSSLLSSGLSVRVRRCDSPQQASEPPRNSVAASSTAVGQSVSGGGGASSTLPQVSSAARGAGGGETTSALAVDGSVSCTSDSMLPVRADPTYTGPRLVEMADGETAGGTAGDTAVGEPAGRTTGRTAGAPVDMHSRDGPAAAGASDDGGTQPPGDPRAAAAHAHLYGASMGRSVPLPVPHATPPWGPSPLAVETADPEALEAAMMEGTSPLSPCALMSLPLALGYDHGEFDERPDEDGAGAQRRHHRDAEEDDDPTTVEDEVALATVAAMEAEDGAAHAVDGGPASAAGAASAGGSGCSAADGPVAIYGHPDVAAAAAPKATAPPQLDLSMCGGALRKLRDCGYAEAQQVFELHRVSPVMFSVRGAELASSPDLVCRMSSNGVIYPWAAVAPMMLGSLAFGVKWEGLLAAGTPCWAPGIGASVAECVGDQSTPKKSSAAASWVMWPFSGWLNSSSNAAAAAANKASVGGGRAGSPLLDAPNMRHVASDSAAASGGPDGRMPLMVGPAGSGDAAAAAGGGGSSVPRVASLPLTGSDAAVAAAAAAAAAAIAGGNGSGPPSTQRSAKHTVVTKRTLVPSAEQLATLKLKPGQNTVAFRVGPSTEVRAFIYLVNCTTKLVISDIDGTITRSDVLGHLLPAIGMDWSHVGITRLFKNVRDNGYQIMYLSSRSVGQANITREYIRTLVQNGQRMPIGPIIISPHGLIPSLYREMWLRRPHEFKIATLSDIRNLFPPDVNPFHAGFGNRDTDEISYREVGVPLNRIFIINPRGELRKAALSVQSSTWSSLSAINSLVDEIFPPIAPQSAEAAVGGTSSDAFNDLQFWSSDDARIIDVDAMESAALARKPKPAAPAPPPLPSLPSLQLQQQMHDDVQSAASAPQLTTSRHSSDAGLQENTRDFLSSYNPFEQ